MGITNFKAGDKVRLINYQGDAELDNAPEIGQEMVVTEIHLNHNVPFPVYTEEGLWAWSELEMVE